MSDLGKLQIEYESVKYEDSDIYEILKEKITDFDSLNITVEDGVIFCDCISDEYVSCYDDSFEGSDFLFQDILLVLDELECKYRGNFIDRNVYNYTYTGIDKMVEYDETQIECPECGSTLINEDETFDEMSDKICCGGCGHWYKPE
ncbi:MAG: hypothetical protein IJZ00_08650 [Lachnospiraceae bacterium]|nr:hypothetical protein [Lachnospiraceae bacterium]